MVCTWQDVVKYIKQWTVEYFICVFFVQILIYFNDLFLPVVVRTKANILSYIMISPYLYWLLVSVAQSKEALKCCPCHADEHKMMHMLNGLLESSSQGQSEKKPRKHNFDICNFDIRTEDWWWVCLATYNCLEKTPWIRKVFSK